MNLWFSYGNFFNQKCKLTADFESKYNCFINFWELKYHRPSIDLEYLLKKYTYLFLCAFSKLKWHKP